MMTPEQAARAAQLLRGARAAVAPLDGLPQACRPRDLDDGYRIQEAFVAQSGDAVAAFKIGATSARAQAFLGVEEPFYGQILADTLGNSPAVLAADDFNFCLVEPEFALCLGAALPARAAPYEARDVALAVEAVAPAIEVVTSGLANWTDCGVPSMIADNGLDGGLILGDARRDVAAVDLANHAVRLCVNGDDKGGGSGANALGHPLNALTWLANQRSRQGRGLAAGSIVSTGVVTPFEILGRGDEAVADFGRLGTVNLRFS